MIDFLGDFKAEEWKDKAETLATAS